MFENTMFLRDHRLPELPDDIKRALGMDPSPSVRKLPSKKVSVATKAKRKRTRASRKANR